MPKADKSVQTVTDKHNMLSLASLALLIARRNCLLVMIKRSGIIVVKIAYHPFAIRTVKQLNLFAFPGAANEFPLHVFLIIRNTPWGCLFDGQNNPNTLFLFCLDFSHRNESLRLVVA